jgi:hypothetical protein
MTAAGAGMAPPPPMQAAPMQLPPQQRVTGAPPAPARGQPPRRPVPPPFGDEPTRQVDDQLLTSLRAQQQMRPEPAPPPVLMPAPVVAGLPRPSFHDEPTRMANVDPRAYDETGPGPGPYTAPTFDRDTNPNPRFPANLPATDPGGYAGGMDHNYEEATSIASLDGMAAMERARHQAPSNEERTRAVNIRSDPSISDIDWDLD